MKWDFTEHGRRTVQKEIKNRRVKGRKCIPENISAQRGDRLYPTARVKGTITHKVVIRPRADIPVATEKDRVCNVSPKHLSAFNCNAGNYSSRVRFLKDLFISLLKNCNWGTPGWLSSWAYAFGSGRDPRVPGLSPTSGSLHGACFSLCLCVSLMNK